MVWAFSCDGSLVNLDHINHVYINDRGPEYTKRYQLIADSLEQTFILAENEDEEIVRDSLSAIFTRLSLSRR